MAASICNVVVVGKSAISSAVLHSLSHPHQQGQILGVHQDDHRSVRNGLHGPQHDDNHEEDHTTASDYKLTLLTLPHQDPPLGIDLHHVVLDYSDGSLIHVLDEAKPNVVISTIAPADVPFQKRLIDAAIAAGVSHFIPCEFSYDTCDRSLRDHFPPIKARAEVLECLKTRSEAVEGFGWTAIATECLLEHSLLQGLLGFDLTWKSATIYRPGEERFRCSSIHWIGQSTARVLRDLRAPKSRTTRYLYEAESLTTQNAILSALERIDGKKWDTVKAVVEECVREGDRRMEKGFFDGAMLLLERIVLFGQTGDVEVWSRSQRECQGREKSLKHAIMKTKEDFKKNGKGDCGCG